MSYGILAKPMRGLGTASTIPGECWEQAGFKDCFSKMFATAQLNCRLQGKENDACIVPATDALVKQGCKCTKKPQVTAFTSLPSNKDEAFEPAEPKIMGFSVKTILITGAVAYGLYTVFMDDSKKGKG